MGDAAVAVAVKGLTPSEIFSEHLASGSFRDEPSALLQWQL